MNETAPPLSNIPEYSVSDITGAVRRTLEGAFSRVRVRGEVTEAKTYGSGHTYLSLKDGGGKIKAVIWRSALSRVGLKPENGVEVIATGKLTTYGDRSEYQLVIDRLEFAGAGALLAKIEALRVKLLAEGLFEAAGKQALPVLPALVGVITSAQGAVLQDIKTTIARRFPRPILLWAVPVQGEGAAARIAAAIEGMDSLPRDGIARPDVLIVARGGGGLEDLMAFNEEVVVRAAAACRIPLISAVGHETDTTLIDFASDRRAPTPTAAAELAVPARAELVADLGQKASRLVGALHRLTQARRLAMGAVTARLPDLPGLLGRARQRLDDRAQRLGLALPNLVATRRSAFAMSGVKLDAAGARAVRRRAEAAGKVMPRLSAAPLLALLRERGAVLGGWAARLESVSHLAVLARGYVLVHDSAGAAVTRAAGVAPEMRLTLMFADGEVGVNAGPKPQAPAG